MTAPLRVNSNENVTEAAFLRTVHSNENVTEAAFLRIVHSNENVTSRGRVGGQPVPGAPGTGCPPTLPRPRQGRQPPFPAAQATCSVGFSAACHRRLKRS